MKSFPSISIIKSVLLVLFTVVSAGEVFSFQSTFVPVDESRLWIEGSSNVNEFECHTEDYTGEATIPETEGSPSLGAVSSELLLLKIDIRADSFECGKQRMNEDLREALKSDQFPEITFLYEDSNVLSAPTDMNSRFQLRVRGLLTIAGTTKEIQFNTEASYISQRRVRATGQTTINMTDYGVKPPTAFMGLIKANEELTVNFDLIAEPKNL